MARFARVVVPGGAYHVTHRGNRRAPIFHSAADREAYLTELERAVKRHGVEIWAYCLMTNHVHLILAEDEPGALSRTIHLAHMSYSRIFNRRCGWNGHLWSNRFFSTLLDEFHLWRAVRYVELNPVRASVVQDATEYVWSSARAHSRRRPRGILSPKSPFPGGVTDWPGFLASELEPEALETIRKNTATGRPTGSEAFVRSLEVRLGRRLRPSKPGRPPAASNQTTGENRGQVRDSGRRVVKLGTVTGAGRKL